MMLLSAIAAVLLAAVAKRRIGAANRARAHTPQDAHAEANEAPPAAGRTTATIIADYDLDAENASETIDAAEVDEVFGGHLPPDVKQVINSLGGRNLRILPQCEDGTYLSGIYDRGDDNYARALATAIADENIVVMNCILAHGGTFEGCPDCRGQTPLLAACFEGSTKIAEYLLARGADITAKTTMDGIPDRPTCLHIAAYYNYQALADVLLAHGAPVDEPMDDGASPLLVACKQGNSEVAQPLLKAGADVTTTSQDGNVWSCLHYAAWYNHPALVDVLLAHGAPVDEPTAPGTGGGASPLFIACEKGHTEVARKLLNAGADPHLARTDGTTPFTMTFEGACDINALMNSAS